MTAGAFASIRRRLTPRHEERSAFRREAALAGTVGAFDVEHVELASDIAEDEIGPRHPRAADRLFLELNPAARARTN